MDDGRVLVESEGAGEALFAFLRSMVLQWGATDRGLKESLSADQVDADISMSAAGAAFVRLLDDLLAAAQDAGAVRADVQVRDVQSILVGCLAMQAENPHAAERLTEVVVDGLRAR